MRIIPIAFAPDANDKAIDAVSSITHAHEISCEACRIYIHIARSLLAGKSVGDAIKENTKDVSETFEPLFSIEQRKLNTIKSSGFVVDTLESALWCLSTTDNFRDAVEKAVNLGGDTDTIGAVTGGLAAIAYGFDAIPAEWVGALRKKEMIDECLF
ncbi:MAG: ADP-ribosylglycohydrolase family protein [Treponema sp.]|nr:ADP-ribosylglycohydrolase family protein [Treponema sp.]